MHNSEYGLWVDHSPFKLSPEVNRIQAVEPQLLFILFLFGGRSRQPASSGSNAGADPLRRLFVLCSMRHLLTKMRRVYIIGIRKHHSREAGVNPEHKTDAVNI